MTIAMTELNDATGAGPELGAAKVRFDSTNPKGSFADVCNPTSTREEAVRNVGASSNRDRTPQDTEIELSRRIVLSPFAAKRLNARRRKPMGEYEARFGELR